MLKYRPFQPVHKITHCAGVPWQVRPELVSMLSDVCKWLTVVLGGPVGQTPPYGPKTLMEPFISCQPAAGYRFSTASFAA